MQLYDYQRTGARWLADRGRTTRGVGLLGDGMGLGKSATAVAAADLLDAETVTIVCPSIMVAAWRETFPCFGDLPREIVSAGAGRLRPARPGVLVASYGLAQRPDVAERIRERRGVVVFDESHYCKDPGSERTRQLFDGGLVDRAARIFCLTGTPLPNHAGELFPVMRLAGLFVGEYRDFVQRYCVTRETEYGFQVLAHRNVEELKALLSVLMLRRMHQVALPPTDVKCITIPLSACDTRGDVFRELRRLAGYDARRVASLVNAGNLKALESAETATERKLVGMLKAVPAAHRIAAVLDRDATNKAVVFCLHSAPIALLAEVLKPYGIIELTGATPKRKVKDLVASFQTDPRRRVALCQSAAAGVGVTLTAANYLFTLERPWSPAVEDQGDHRIIRIGQTRPTFVRRISLENSIDDAVNRVLLRKTQLISEILN
jgi:SWI/SNF-related matrix-associated actin-dependent regulator 1 of chromatin subfamily A